MFSQSAAYEAWSLLLRTRFITDFIFISLQKLACRAGERRRSTPRAWNTAGKQAATKRNAAGRRAGIPPLSPIRAAGRNESPPAPPFAKGGTLKRTGAAPPPFVKGGWGGFFSANPDDAHHAPSAIFFNLETPAGRARACGSRAVWRGATRRMAAPRNEAQRRRATRKRRDRVRSGPARAKKRSTEVSGF